VREDPSFGFKASSPKALDNLASTNLLVRCSTLSVDGSQRFSAFPVRGVRGHSLLSFAGFGATGSFAELKLEAKKSSKGRTRELLSGASLASSTAADAELCSLPPRLELLLLRRDVW